jgi:acyl-CoA reductase-like NAD-dependent aldehyde dehydrogenase
MSQLQRTFSPIDGSLLVERQLVNVSTAQVLGRRARAAQIQWASASVEQRCEIVARFAECLKLRTDEIARELTLQMGRPIKDSPGEVRGVLERVAYMRESAPGALAPITLPHKPGFRRSIEREPVGVVLVLSPWNYPFLTAINAVVPALLAGNAVMLKHSAQTPLCAERLLQAFSEAGLPDGLFQVIHMDHGPLNEWIALGELDHVAFTGSVAGGDAVARSAAVGRVSVGLELGGKDPAYVRRDANIARAIDGVVDGAFYNAGQSCCAVERVYVDSARYDEFVDGFVELTRKYVLGDPREAMTTLGPLVRVEAAELVRRQVAEAVHQGARSLIDPRAFALDKAGTAYLAPQVLVDVTQAMAVMRDESFGPVVGIVSVSGDDEAVRLMNDSDYGLTASLWTEDLDEAKALAKRLETGTVFMNRCDYLDPALAWTGVKKSGRGHTLSVLGFDAFVRPKSLHFRL